MSQPASRIKSRVLLRIASYRDVDSGPS